MLPIQENIKDVLNRVLHYDIKEVSNEEIVIPYIRIKTDHNFNFRVINNPATLNIEVYTEGQSICDKPTHIISHRIIEHIQQGGECYIYNCETCIGEQKQTRLICGVNVSEMVPTPFLGKSIVLISKPSDTHMKREVYCTRPGCVNNVMELKAADGVPASEVYAKHIVLMKPKEELGGPCPGDCDVCYAKNCLERRCPPKEGS